MWFKHPVKAGQTGLHVSFNPAETQDPADVELKVALVGYSRIQPVLPEPNRSASGIISRFLHKWFFFLFIWLPSALFVRIKVKGEHKKASSSHLCVC